jgi:hypothetical protein
VVEVNFPILATPGAKTEGVFLWDPVILARRGQYFGQDYLSLDNPRFRAELIDAGCDLVPADDIGREIEVIWIGEIHSLYPANIVGFVQNVETAKYAYNWGTSWQASS